MVCGIQILSISLPRLCLPATIRPSRARSRGTGKDESAPPVCRSSGKQERGFVAYPAPLFWGIIYQSADSGTCYALGGFSVWVISTGRSNL